MEYVSSRESFIFVISSFSKKVHWRWKYHIMWVGLLVPLLSFNSYVSYGESVTCMDDGTSLEKAIKSVSQIKRVKIF